MLRLLIALESISTGPPTLVKLTVASALTPTAVKARVRKRS